MFGLPPRPGEDELPSPADEARPPDSPLAAALKRTLWLVISILILLSLLAPLLAPLFRAILIPTPRPPGIQVFLARWANM
jgi:lipopolysaccharide/colanic/teichoic acid biosynthesis glycosyltransferase